MGRAQARPLLVGIKQFSSLCLKTELLHVGSITHINGKSNLMSLIHSSIRSHFCSLLRSIYIINSISFAFNLIAEYVGIFVGIGTRPTKDAPQDLLLNFNKYEYFCQHNWIPFGTGFKSNKNKHGIKPQRDTVSNQVGRGSWGERDMPDNSFYMNLPEIPCWHNKLSVL